jgi:hypothetical protein
MAEGGFGGNSAMPERIQKEAAPAARSVRSGSKSKSFLFLFEEKNRRAQIKKCEENFLAGWRASASGGGAASLVGVLLKESSNINQKRPPIFQKTTNSLYHKISSSYNQTENINQTFNESP